MERLACADTTIGKHVGKTTITASWSCARTFAAAVALACAWVAHAETRVFTEVDCGKSTIVRLVRGNDAGRVERLLRDGLNPNLKSTTHGLTLLMCAVGGREVNPNVVTALLDAGADVNAKTAAGETALMWAVSTGAGRTVSTNRVNAVRQLIARGADLDATDAKGETAVLRAVSMGYAQIVAQLLGAGADPYAGNGADENPLERARRLGFSDVAKVAARYITPVSSQR